MEFPSARIIYHGLQSFRRFIQPAKKHQYAVIASLPATGKTSLLQLLKNALESEGSNVICLSISDDGHDKLMAKLECQGIVDDKQKLKDLNPTWLLLDDAQNAYTPKSEIYSVLAVCGERDIGIRHR
jgi:predicted AAA+ superfamily ATPase